MAKTKEVNFRSIETLPIDVRKILLAENAKDKAKRGTNKYSVNLTIIKIIREWKSKCNADQ